MSGLAQKIKEKTKEELIASIPNLTINESMENLYIILLQYYTSLIKRNHPKVNLITDLLDNLIELKKTNIKEEEAKTKFDEIHHKAYNNIEHIYEYDKVSEEEEKRIDNLQLIN